MSTKVTDAKSSSKSLASAATQAERFAVFGPPQLVEGEDSVAYDELFARVRAAVKPVDIIEEIFVNDVVCLQWEILRWRRLKTSLIRATGSEALEKFLSGALDYDLYRKDFEEDLAEILQENVAENQVEDFAQELARRCARNEPDAVENVNELLAAAGLHMDKILDSARDRKVQELTQAYTRRELDVVEKVNELLASSGRTMDGLMANTITDYSGYRSDRLAIMERIDHLTTIAETRRNAMLLEIDRHRAVLGEALRRNVQEVEGECEVIEETAVKAQSAA